MTKMKQKNIRRYKEMENIRKKYVIYCDTKKRIIVENITEDGACGPLVYVEKAKLTDLCPMPISKEDEQLLVVKLSADSLKEGDFFIWNDEVYCLIRTTDNINVAQICDLTGDCTNIPDDVIVDKIEIASNVPDSALDKIAKFFI